MQLSNPSSDVLISGVTTETTDITLDEIRNADELLIPTIEALKIIPAADEETTERKNSYGIKIAPLWQLNIQ